VSPTHKAAERRKYFGVEMSRDHDSIASKGGFRSTSGRSPQQELDGGRGVKDD
jgi:hypothetical protein